MREAEDKLLKRELQTQRLRPGLDRGPGIRVEVCEPRVRGVGGEPVAGGRDR